ncbi:MAG: DUF4440 domain-containing protein [Alphaproteobacteria bacterium]|nr:DUF4440 domain-containing protein [Alphaproteobacteria bacterium]
MKDTIYALELSLLNPITRQSVVRLNRLIADDFVEFGCAGRMYNKKATLHSLPLETNRNFTVEHFIVTELSQTIMLVTYTLIEEGRKSLRSSIWRFKEQQWQIIFHQGTVVQ